MQPLPPPPPSGRIYRTSARVRLSDMDPEGRVRIDAVDRRAALDERGLPRILRHAAPVRMGTGKSGRLETALGEEPGGLVVIVHRQVGRIHALGEIPPAVASLAAHDRHLALPQEEVQHVRHLIRSRPPVGCAAHLCGVGDLGGQQRAVGPQPRQDVGAVEPLEARAR